MTKLYTFRITSALIIAGLVGAFIALKLLERGL